MLYFPVCEQKATAYQTCFARVAWEKGPPQSLTCQQFQFSPSSPFHLQPGSPTILQSCHPKPQTVTVREIPSETLSSIPSLPSVQASTYQSNKLKYLPMLEKGQTCLLKGILDFSLVNKDVNNTLVLVRLMQKRT